MAPPASRLCFCHHAVLSRPTSFLPQAHVPPPLSHPLVSSSSPSSSGRSAPLNWDLSSPSGLKGACFWMSDKRRMPPNDARPEVNERYSQGAQEEVVRVDTAAVTVGAAACSVVCAAAASPARHSKWTLFAHVTILSQPRFVVRSYSACRVSTTAPILCSPGRHLARHPPVGLVQLARSGPHSSACPAGTLGLPRALV